MTGETNAGPLQKDIAECRSCHANVVWMRTSAGKNMPVNVLVSPTGKTRGLRSPNAGEFKFEPGVHESHFATCPQAARHRRGEVKDGDG